MLVCWSSDRASVRHGDPGRSIERVTRELVAQNAGRPGFLVGITENIPASVGARSLEAIGRAVR
jgi:hypothetical protein